MGDRPRLGHQLPEHDVQERDRADGDDGGDAPAGQEVDGTGQRREPVAKQMGDGILGNVAEEDGCEGDAELGRREEPVQLPERLAHDPRLAVAAADHRLDSRAAGCDERELGRYEEGVGRDQGDDGQEAQAQDVHGLIVLDLRRGHIRASR